MIAIDETRVSRMAGRSTTKELRSRRLQLQPWVRILPGFLGVAVLVSSPTYAQLRHTPSVFIFEGSVVKLTAKARTWALVNDSTMNEFKRGASDVQTYGPANPAIIAVVLDCDSESQLQSPAQSFALGRADAHARSITIPGLPCVAVIADWGGSGAATVDEPGASARAHLFSVVTFDLVSGGFCGPMVWDVAYIRDPSDSSPVVRDPLVAVVIDPSTGEVIARKMLLAINVDSDGGAMSWENNVFSSEATDLRLEFIYPGEWTYDAGHLLVVVEDDVVIASSGSGVFEDVSLPEVGSSGSFNMALENALSVELNSAAMPVGMVRLVMDGGQEMEAGEPYAPGALPWSDDLDFYGTGGGIHGQGGWSGWDNDPSYDANISVAEQHSAPHSVNIEEDADLVHEFSGADSGTWAFSAWQYVPSTHSGDSYFILLNTYEDGGPYNWSTQVRFNGDTEIVHSDSDGAELALITDEWVELRVEIDLDADLQTFYYGGSELYTKSWTEGVTGDGAFDIAAVDLFANGSTSVYYDDMRLELVTCSADRDIDSDGDVDLDDYALFDACLTGPGGGPVPPECRAADSDCDDDVDWADFGAFQLAFTGAP